MDQLTVALVPAPQPEGNLIGGLSSSVRSVDSVELQELSGSEYGTAASPPSQSVPSSVAESGFVNHSLARQDVLEPREAFLSTPTENAFLREELRYLKRRTRWLAVGMAACVAGAVAIGLDSFETTASLAPTLGAWQLAMVWLAHGGLTGIIAGVLRFLQNRYKADTAEITVLRLEVARVLRVRKP